MIFFFVQAEDGIRDRDVTGVQTCALPILRRRVRLVHAGLAAAIGLLPGLLAGCKPTVTSVRSALGAEIALVCLRDRAARHLRQLPPPLGFGHRPPAESGAGPAGRYAVAPSAAPIQGPTRGDSP